MHSSCAVWHVLLPLHQKTPHAGEHSKCNACKLDSCSQSVFSMTCQAVLGSCKSCRVWIPKLEKNLPVGVWELGSDPNFHSRAISLTDEIKSVGSKRSWGCWGRTCGPWINQPCILVGRKIYSILGGIGQAAASRSREGTHPRCGTGVSVSGSCLLSGAPSWREASTDWQEWSGGAYLGWGPEQRGIPILGHCPQATCGICSIDPTGSRVGPETPYPAASSLSCSLVCTL